MLTVTHFCLPYIFVVHIISYFPSTLRKTLSILMYLMYIMHLTPFLITSKPVVWNKLYVSNSFWNRYVTKTIFYTLRNCTIHLLPILSRFGEEIRIKYCQKDLIQTNISQNVLSSMQLSLLLMGNTCNKKDKIDQIAINYVVELCSNNPSLTI